MKIAYTFSSIYNSRGMERILLQKASYLADVLNYDVTIITTDQKNRPPFFPISDKIKLHDLNINYDRYESTDKLLRFFYYKRLKKIHKKRLSDYLSDNRFDIVISLMTHDVDFLYKIQDGSKKLIEFHFSKEGIIIDCQNVILKCLKFIQQSYLKKYIKRYDKFIVLTEEDKRAWGALENIIVIPNFTIISKIDDVRNLNAKKVIAVGSLVYQKGFDLLLKAWKIVVQSHPDFKLTIFGSGNPSNLRNIIANQDISGSVEILSPTQNISAEYLNSALFVLSSRHEGLPLVLIEAMAHGLPVVSFKCPCGPSEIVKHEFGSLVEREDVRGLGIEISKWLSNPSNLIAGGDKAREAAKKYDIGIVMKLWDILFKEIVLKK